MKYRENMDARIAPILAEVRHHFEEVYGDRFVQLVLFGSQARGDAVEGSDIDLLVVLKGPVDRWNEIERNSGFCSALSLDREVVLSCYAMFYVAEALLDGEGLSFSSHSEVIGAFGLHFVKSGRIDPAFHKYLRAAYEVRSDADYDYQVTITGEAAAVQIDRARLFIETAERLLSPA